MTISIKAQIMRIINRILVIAICGLVLTINALAWLLWNLDVNPYRTQITAAIIKQTGWKVDLAGTVTHRMLTNGFRVVAKDIKIIDPTGQFVDVQELRANIALDSIFERYILVQNLEIDVRTCDIELRPEVNPPLPIVVTMEASSLHLTARDCHVYDSESTLDTQIKRLILDVAPIPILLDGWIVMGMPAGITTAKQSGHVTANSVDFGNILGLKELQLDFTNDHGVVSLSNLTTALQAPKPNTSGLLTSPLVTINGKVHLGFDEPLQTLFVTLWNGIDDVWLKPITITAGNLTVNNHNNPINLKDLKIDSAGLPLLVHGSNPIKWWLHPTTHSAIMVKRTTISGSAAFNSIANLTDYSINLDLSPGILEAAIQQGTLGIGLANNNLVNSIILDLNGNLRLLTQGPPPTKLLSTNSDIMPYNLKLDQFTLGIQQVEIATPSGPYNIGSGSLQIVDFPLITGTKPLPQIY
ncbi:hypothetical protein TI04_02455 [Achromatium sp. WMS2]|nr:hypothetical protein TI04_02455 [Achromatium sp. WMS2]